MMCVLCRNVGARAVLSAEDTRLGDEVPLELEDIDLKYVGGLPHMQSLAYGYEQQL